MKKYKNLRLQLFNNILQSKYLSKTISKLKRRVLKFRYKRIHVVTFAKGNFLMSAELLRISLGQHGITNFKIIRENDLSPEFKEKNKDILQLKKGYGYCIWKPHIILTELLNLKKNNILLYIDSTDLPTRMLFDFIISQFKNNSILLFNRGYKNSEWTKRDCFVFMDCDNEKYYHNVQLEAGLLAFIKTDFNIELIKKWQIFANNHNILTEIPNITGLPNLDGFVEHRYDQSILTNLAIFNNLESHFVNDDYIKYNYNQPKVYG